MKTKLLVTVIGAGMLAASSAAWSQAATNFYAGGSIGQSKINDACEGLPSTFSCDDKATAWKIFGGYRINPNLALELGYNDFGKVKASGVFSGISMDLSAAASAWELTGIGSLPLGNRFAAYGKLGVYYGETKSSGTGTSGGTSASVSLSDTNTGLTFGLGASYDLTQNVALRAEWQRFNDVGGSDTGKSNIDVLALGALYRF